MNLFIPEKTSAGTRLRCQLLINSVQQLKKLGVLQYDLAQFDGLFSWQRRDPQMVHLFKFPEGDPPVCGIHFDLLVACCK